jgi:cytochrome b subunit of formate dehydrogenase
MGFVLNRFTISERLLTSAMTMCGLVMALTPPALWFAWTTGLFVGFLIAGVAAGVLYCWLATFEEEIDVKKAMYTPLDHPEINDEVLEEILSLGPFTCHQSSAPNSAYQRQLAKVKKLLLK